MTAIRQAKAASRRRGEKEPPLLRALSAEVFGAFVLVFVDAGGAVIGRLDHDAVSPVGRALATGLTIMALIYSLGPCSGAHLNPAVTSAFCLRGDFPWRRAPGYWGAQLLGACAAASLLRALLGNIGNLGATEPAHGILAALVMEVVLTLMLVSVILSTAVRYRIIGSDAALAVGGIIAVCGLFSRPISGASMNPARSLGPALISGHLDSVWIYILGPLVGAGLAVAIVHLLHGPRQPEEETAARGE